MWNKFVSPIHTQGNKESTTEAKNLYVQNYHVYLLFYIITIWITGFNLQDKEYINLLKILLKLRHVNISLKFNPCIGQFDDDIMLSPNYSWNCDLAS
jgi:hypothetical protein